MEVHKDYTKKITEIRIPAEGTKEDRTRTLKEQGESVFKERDDKSLAVLTKDQKAKIDTMRGPTFEVDMTEIPFFSGRRK